MNINANLVAEPIFSSFEKDGETVEVVNFALVKKYGKGKEYINCAAYGEKVGTAKDFERGYLSAYMVSDMEKMEAVMENPYILMTDKKITNIQEILPILEQIVQQGRKLLIISEDVEGEALATIVLISLEERLTVWL